MRVSTFFSEPELFIQSTPYDPQVMRRLLCAVQTLPHDVTSQAALYVNLRGYAQSDPCAIGHTWRIEATRRMMRMGRLDDAEAYANRRHQDCPFCQADSLMRLSIVLFEQALVSGAAPSRALEAAVEGRAKFSELARSFPDHAYVLKCCECAVRQIEARALDFCGRLPEALKVFKAAYQLALLRPEIPPRSWGVDANQCPSLPNYDLKTRIQRASFGNIVVALSRLPTASPQQLREMYDLLPAIRRGFPKKRFPYDHWRAVWLETRIKATRHNDHIRPQKRHERRRVVERKLSRVFAGMLEHGTPADAVCVLLDVATLPWLINKPGKLPGIVAACFDQRDTKTRRQLADQLLAMEAQNPELHSQVADLIRAADRRDVLSVHAGVGRLYDALHTNGGSWPRFAAWDNTEGLRKTGPKGPRKRAHA